jgi:hypothetical protein
LAEREAAVGAPGRGTRISLMLDELVRDGCLSDVLRVFVDPKLEQRSSDYFAGGSGRAGASSGAQVVVREPISDEGEDEGEEPDLVLPDVPSGRLFFYTTLSWHRQRVQRSQAEEEQQLHLNTLVRESTMNLFDAVCGGLCPPELLEEVVNLDLIGATATDGGFERADGSQQQPALSRSQVVQLLTLVQRAKSDPLAASRSGRGTTGNAEGECHDYQDFYNLPPAATRELGLMLLSN